MNTRHESAEPAESTKLAEELEEMRQFEENEAFNAWRENILANNPEHDFYACA